MKALPFALALMAVLTIDALDALPAKAGDDSATCRAAALRAEQEYGLPEGLLVAITTVESGRHAYALNLAGNAVMPDTVGEAARLLRAPGAAGIRSDAMVGCSQLYARYHASAFGNAAERMLDPVENTEYAARLLASLQERYGSWTTAVGAFNATPGTAAHRAYICRIDAQLAQQRGSIRLGCDGSNS